MSFAGHVLRGSSGDSTLRTCGLWAILRSINPLNNNNNNCRYWKRNWTVPPQSFPRRMWIDDIKHWMKLKTYEEIKWIAQHICQWRNRTAACDAVDCCDCAHASLAQLTEAAAVCCYLQLIVSQSVSWEVDPRVVRCITKVIDFMIIYSHFKRSLSYCLHSIPNVSSP